MYQTGEIVIVLGTSSYDPLVQAAHIQFPAVGQVYSYQGADQDDQHWYNVLVTANGNEYVLFLSERDITGSDPICPVCRVLAEVRNGKFVAHDGKSGRCYGSFMPAGVYAQV